MVRLTLGEGICCRRRHFTEVHRKRPFDSHGPEKASGKAPDWPKREPNCAPHGGGFAHTAYLERLTNGHPVSRLDDLLLPELDTGCLTVCQEWMPTGHSTHLASAGGSGSVVYGVPSTDVGA